MSNNNDIHNVVGYINFLECFTDLASNLDPSPERKEEVTQGVDALLDARTVPDAHRALNYLNPFLGEDAFNHDLKDLVHVAKESMLDRSVRRNLKRLQKEVERTTKKKKTGRSPFWS